jgi:LCP family protein required for cell wall assembly
MSQSDGAATRPNNQAKQPNPAVGKPTVVIRTSPPSDAARAHRTGAATAAERSIALVKAQKRRQRIVIFSILGFAVLLGSLGTAVYYYVLNNIVEPGVKIIEVSQTPIGQRIDEQGTPVPVSTPPSLEEPINILLLGLDERPGDEAPLADTQIVVRVDPLNKRAIMFSVPRDTWVRIPGYGEGRINTSYQIGKLNEADVPGGGPTLAMSTIEHNFGIRIHYYAQVNFTGFERVIDAMGGVTVDVARPLVDSEYPLPNYGTSRIYIPAGIQHMNGKIALQFARSRHSDSDLGRNSRQQQVLLALRQQGLTFDIIGKLPELADELSDSVVTDLDVDKLFGLARLAQDIGPASIETFLIEPPMVYETTLLSGAQVLMPDWSLIRPKVAELFADPRVAREDPTIVVLNGTFTNGMAAKVQTTLMERGVPIAAIASAPDQGDHDTTTVVDYTGGEKPDTLAAILNALGLGDAAAKEGATPEWVINSAGDAVQIVRRAPNGSTPVDFIVTVGNDRVAVLGTPTPAP